MKIDFCLPVYNEEKILAQNAGKLLRYCQMQNFAFDWRVVIVVNGSSDHSGDIARKLQDENPGVVLAIEYTVPGRGQAIKRFWLDSEADIVAYMDIDLAVSLDDIVKLVGPIISGEADLVVGSRLLVNSKIERSIIREITSQSCHFISRLMLGHKFSDLQCGFKAINRRALESVAPLIIDKGWFFDTELAVFTYVMNYRVIEIPVDWSEDRYDRRQSKVKIIRDTSQFLRNFVRLRHRLKRFKKNT